MYASQSQMQAAYVIRLMTIYMCYAINNRFSLFATRLYNANENEITSPTTSYVINENAELMKMLIRIIYSALEIGSGQARHAQAENICALRMKRVTTRAARWKRRIVTVQVRNSRCKWKLSKDRNSLYTITNSQSDPTMRIRIASKQVFQIEE